MAALVSARPATRYELPPEGISLLGYVVRRMHKTRLLAPVAGLLDEGRPREVLAQVALYAAASATSYGPAYYQPGFNQTGEQVAEADPETGFRVQARLDARQPHYRISCEVSLPGGARLTGQETITGTTVGLGGLGMPAPSRFDFVDEARGYTASIQGVITSELAPRLFDRWQVRGHGELSLQDSAGNTGRLRLGRNGRLEIRVQSMDGGRFQRQAKVF